VQNYWHYIDCHEPKIVRYAHGLLPSSLNDRAYMDGVYSPSQDRVYFSPLQQAQAANFQENWHYVDCEKIQVHAYPNHSSFAYFGSYSYISGSYSPLENKIYFAPYGQSPASFWHGIKVFSQSGLSRQYGSLNF
jgi:hypothetical protein